MIDEYCTILTFSLYSGIPHTRSHSKLMNETHNIHRIRFKVKHIEYVSSMYYFIALASPYYILYLDRFILMWNDCIHFLLDVLHRALKSLIIERTLILTQAFQWHSPNISFAPNPSGSVSFRINVGFTMLFYRDIHLNRFHS